MMRYFFSVAFTKEALASSVGMAPAPGGAVAFRCAAQRLIARFDGTALKAVDVAVVAVLANQYLAMTTGTVEHSG